MDTGFLVDRNPVRAGSGERRNKFIRIFDHQVAVERNVHSFTQGRDYRWTDRNIGHKVAVHHINMEEGGATSHRGVCIFRQAGEIGRQN